MAPVFADAAYYSFIVMTDRGLTDALSGDHHFEQAGFQGAVAHRVETSICYLRMTMRIVLS